jgi:hypothetical protein
MICEINNVCLGYVTLQIAHSYTCTQPMRDCIIAFFRGFYWSAQNDDISLPPPCHSSSLQCILSLRLSNWPDRPAATEATCLGKISSPTLGLEQRQIHKYRGGNICIWCISTVHTCEQLEFSTKVHAITYGRTRGIFVQISWFVLF